MPLTTTELESKLWGAADILRGQIDSSDYKNFIFSVLFLKRLSDRFAEEVDSAVGAGLDREVAESDHDEHEFFVPPEARWSEIVRHSMNLGEVLNRAGAEIEEANAPRLDGVLRNTNWNDESKLGGPASRDRIIGSLLRHFDTLDLSDANLTGEGEHGAVNVLGDAYEYLIRQFADDAGKKGGEFYTPRSVVRLIVELLEPAEGMRICDPTAGSAGMLIYTAQYVAEQGGDPRNLVLHGQERNLGTLAIGKLNLLLHGLRSARYEAGDVISDPQLRDERGRLLAYDRVIANPPFSLKAWGRDFAPGDPHHRFDRYGAIPPRTKGDLAFVQHMLAVTNPGGMVGVVMPHGILFRGGAEGTIRKGMIEADLFEAVIGLAPNLFYGASIPVAICVFNKAKPADRRGRVLFVDAAQPDYFRSGKAQNFLDPEHVAAIVGAFRAYEEVERFAHVADLDEIAANDHNLNISRYVDTTEPVEVLSVEDALAQLREAERRRDEAAVRMDEQLAGLGYARDR
ncbi:MAG: class I SAM-dependent DNA methyltransferase [Acidimicrobiaceae bacterium]|nr:class I SAM-dependent DNA methyltransferase [Acidimicrobiaceae bacterium]